MKLLRTRCEGAFVAVLLAMVSSDRAPLDVWSYETDFSCFSANASNARFDFNSSYLEEVPDV